MKKQRICLMTLILSVALLFTGCPELETSESNRNNSGEQTSVQLTDETEHTKSSVHTNDNPTLATTKAKESTTAETEPSEEATTSEQEETTTKQTKQTKQTTEATVAPTTEAPAIESTTKKETKQELDAIVVPAIVEEEPFVPSEALDTEAPSSGGGGGSGSGSGDDYWFDFAYVANANSKKFHRAGCSSIGDMSDSNKIGYNSAQEAIDDGFVPCKRCHPENDI